MRLISLVFVLLLACQGNREVAENSEKQKPSTKKRPVSIENGKIFSVGDKKMLYGGKDSLHFDITDCELKDEQFHYGIGRETFPALLEPSFTTVEVADTQWHDTTRFLVAYSGDEIKAYSVTDLTRHEIVNDVLDGKPIMAAYCILANLGVIYKRTYGNDTLTYALSGYTYYDPEVWDGLDGFVFWDRETESLWWPLIGRAVSGPLKGVSLLEMDKAYWEDTNWKTVKEKYPAAQVLASGQDFERPKTWDRSANVNEIVEKYGTAGRSEGLK